MKKALKIIGICMLAVLLILAACYALPQWQYRQEIRRQEQICEQIMEKVRQGIEEMKPEEIVLTEEEQEMAWNRGGVFFTAESRELIARKLSGLYCDRDLEGILQMLAFIGHNTPFATVTGELEIPDIVFDPEVLAFLQEELEAAGCYQETGDQLITYRYGDWDIHVRMDLRFIWLRNPIGEYGLSIILGTTGYRAEQYGRFDTDSSRGYYYVGTEVEYVESRCGAAEKYYPAGTCPRCGTSYREDTSLAMSVVENGYCGYGLCGRD